MRDCWVRVNNVDLSDHMSEVTVSMSAADVDTTAMGAGGHQRILGIRDDSFNMTAFSDFAAAKVHATVNPLFVAGSLFLVEVAASGSTISATNPKFSGTCILTEYSPIAGAVGDAAMTPLTFPVNGTIAIGTT
jgi:predicted secreted protein